MVENKHTPANS